MESLVSYGSDDEEDFDISDNLMGRSRDSYRGREQEDNYDNVGMDMSDEETNNTSPQRTDDRRSKSGFTSRGSSKSRDDLRSSNLSREITPSSKRTDDYRRRSRTPIDTRLKYDRSSDSRRKELNKTECRSYDRKEEKYDSIRRERKKGDRSGSKDRRRSNSQERIRSRSRDSYKRRSRSPKSIRRRSGSRDNKDRSRSRDRKVRSRSREKRYRSRSREKRDASRSRDRKVKSRSRDRKIRSKSQERKEMSKSGDITDKSRNYDRKDRSKSRDRRDRSRSRNRQDRSRSHDHKDRSRSRERKERSRSPRGYKNRFDRTSNKLAVLEKLGIEIKTPDSQFVSPQTLMHKSLSDKIEEVKNATGIELPKYYNPAVMNPSRYAEQIQKRRLLWGNKRAESNSAPSCITSSCSTSSAASTATAAVPKLWQQTKFVHDSDGKVASKFKRLMGIKDDSVPTKDKELTNTETLKKQEEMFHSMEAQYEVARAATHTMRGVGLGFGAFTGNFPR